MNRRELVRKLFALPAIAVMVPMPVVKSYHGRWDDVLAVSLEVEEYEEMTDEEKQTIADELKETIYQEAGRVIPCFLCQKVRLRIHTRHGDAETEVASSEVAS